MTCYMILVRCGPGVWEETHMVQANSTAQAVVRLEGDDGTYVAVQERSWQPVELRTETFTRVTVVRSKTQAKAGVEG